MIEGPKTIAHILTGFLGSGKTTLLNRLLAARAYKDTAIVVNELGEIGLDHLLVSERTDQIALLEGGCLCCAVIDSLPETLLDLCRRRAAEDIPYFKRIVIETTGLGDPGPISDVIRHSSLLNHFLAPGVIVTALDMLDAGGILERHPEAVSQVALADRIVMTKLDLRDAITEEERSALAEMNPFAEVLTGDDILAAPERLIAPPLLAAPPQPAERHGHAAHSHGIHAFSFSVADQVTRAGLAAFARACEYRLGQRLLRCKGIVRTVRDTVLIQGVSTRFSFVDVPEIPPDSPFHVTFIVQGLQRDDVAPLISWLFISEGTLPPNSEEVI